MTNNTPQEILQTIKNSNKILINMDTRTDFDALCSSKVFKHWLQRDFNKTADIIHANKINDTFNTFFTYEDIQQGTDISKVNLEAYDLVIFLDSGTSAHISLDDNYKLPANIKTLNIDHHKTNTLFGQLNYVLELGSCTSVLYKLFQELDVTLDDFMVLALGIGIITDTGFFKFDSETSDDFRITADLMDRGLKVHEIIFKLSSTESIDQIRYKELVYSKLVYLPEQHVAYCTITLDEIASKNIDMKKVFVRHSDLIKYIEGVDYAFVLAETASVPKYWELSFRSKDPAVDVTKLAAIWGGGGHITGAGAKLYEGATIEEALNIVLTKLKL